MDTFCIDQRSQSSRTFSLFAICNGNVFSPSAAGSRICFSDFLKSIKFFLYGSIFSYNDSLHAHAMANNNLRGFVFERLQLTQLFNSNNSYVDVNCCISVQLPVVKLLRRLLMSFLYMHINNTADQFDLVLNELNLSKVSGLLLCCGILKRVFDIGCVVKPCVQREGDFIKLRFK